MTSHPLGVSRRTLPFDTARAPSSQRAVRSRAEEGKSRKEIPRLVLSPNQIRSSRTSPTPSSSSSSTGGLGPSVCGFGMHPSLACSICGPDAGSCALRFRTQRMAPPTSRPSCAGRRTPAERSWTPHTPRIRLPPRRSTANRYSSPYRPSEGRVSRPSATARPKGVAGSALRP